ncbi:MAG TPA: prepilin-type N-terminal cleavage/methylation domain-containing protein [Candidatus Paceibacterota bacterium]|jgi:prepilin-type N-terminal cleavage/methylation domain-containing protein|nr:hypothetical protein [Parcubacteria group bacterium]MDP6119354.1 prepilin-type N-terminal cleavage/methylation domain-containing protein [Candidatus Paceibacterota bacterium]HJN62670.1 prepilin-type N-terminal cleavage/methylation domain-containing protein [Candidatus Paceibacterota bacterium]|tara:strand:- start:802 stop:1254 length:453 start_codon:yes stop_codon:yes gene_type:complete
MKSRGFTLIEIIIAFVILAVLATVIFGVFRTFDESQALSRDVSNVVSIVERARQLTLFSKDSSKYGVHFASDEVVLFKGGSYYSSNPDNIVTKLHSKIFIQDINLNGGVSDLVFERLSGETEQNGTITLQSKTDSSKTKTLTIEKTGLVR